MHELSQHIRIVNDCLYNTVTSKRLPLDADFDTLKSNLFLAGQETEAIHARLFSRQSLNILKLTLIPTWECSLRCTHCCVISRLVKKQIKKFDFELFKQFVDRYCHKYKPDAVYASIIGGEPLLEPSVCLEIAKYIKSLSCKNSVQITTNLIQEINDATLDVFDQVDLIAVSLDGLKHQHNEQRRSAEFNDPYQITIDNINAVVQYGFQDKLHVQGAMRSTTTALSKKEYYRSLLSIGVKFENIIYGVVFPTLKDPIPDPHFLKLATDYASPLPCCKYRYMSNFVIDASNNIYIDYLDETKSDIVGHLTNINWDEIENNYKNCIMNTMHALHDENCLVCPAIGICWGGCVHNQHINNGKPSSICNQSKIVKYLDDLTSNGKVIEVVDKFVTTKQCRIDFAKQ